MKTFLDFSKQTLVEGGGYGHLAHPYDVPHNTFGDLKTIILHSFTGKLDSVEEKTDGQNLMVTFKNGHVLAARNKGHIKNFGEGALTLDQLIAMFSGRGAIETAFGNAIEDMEAAIKAIGAKEAERIFGEGRRFVSIEVMYIDTENVVHYGMNEIRFHETVEHDEDGNPIGRDRNLAKSLAAAIKRVEANRQKTFHIKPIKAVKLPVIPNYRKIVSRFYNMMDDIMKQYGLNNRSTIQEYQVKWWESYLTKQLGKLPDDVMAVLIDRFAKNDKSVKITAIDKMVDPLGLKDKVRAIDKDNSLYKDMMLPLEKLFLAVGAEVILKMTDFMAVNPDKTIRSLKDKLEAAVADIKATGDGRQLDRLALELERLEAAGGVKAIMPTEGLTFIYKGQLMKYTGTFAPLNQIIGMLRFAK